MSNGDFSKVLERAYAGPFEESSARQIYLAWLLIRERNHWTKYTFQNTDGQRWCAVGALRLTSNSLFEGGGAQAYLRKAAALLGHASAITLNDTGTHADVMRLYEVAYLMAAGAEAS